MFGAQLLRPVSSGRPGAPLQADALAVLQDVPLLVHEYRIVELTNPAPKELASEGPPTCRTRTSS